MERPSHILFARHSSLSRAPWMGLAIGLQVAGICFFVYGLKDTVTKFVPHPIFVDPIEQVEHHLPPPPPPPLRHVEMPKAQVPIFTTQTTDPGNSITTTTAPPQQTTTLTQPLPPPVERAAVSIAGTHTTPPYPPAARRLGLEGVVTLRLTVGTDGRVSAAEVVTSAGSAELDQVARDWILSHWRYRPALKDGNPAPAQVLASVAYSLKNER